MAMGRTASDANIIIGGLLLFWGLMGALYMTRLHVAPAGCSTSAIDVGGACYRTWFYFVFPVAIGAIMMMVGTFNREPAAAAEDLLRTDPFTWTVLGVFLSTSMAAGIAAFYLSYDLLINNVDPGNWVMRGGAYPALGTTTLIATLAGIVFVVGFFINAAHVRRRRRFHAGFQRAVARHRGGET